MGSKKTYCDIVMAELVRGYFPLENRGPARQGSLFSVENKKAGRGARLGDASLIGSRSRGV